MFRRIILFLLALGFLGGGGAAGFGQYALYTRSGNPDDLYAGLFMAGLLGVVGLVLLWIAIRGPRKGAAKGGAQAAVWAVGMNTLADDYGDDGGGD